MDLAVEAKANFLAAYRAAYEGVSGRHLAELAEMEKRFPDFVASWGSADAVARHLRLGVVPTVWAEWFDRHPVIAEIGMKEALRAEVVARLKTELGRAVRERDVAIAAAEVLKRKLSERDWENRRQAAVRCGDAARMQQELLRAREARDAAVARVEAQTDSIANARKLEAALREKDRVIAEQRKEIVRLRDGDGAHRHASSPAVFIANDGETATDVMARSGCTLEAAQRAVVLRIARARLRDAAKLGGRKVR